MNIKLCIMLRKWNSKEEILLWQSIFLKGFHFVLLAQVNVPWQYAKKRNKIISTARYFSQNYIVPNLRPSRKEVINLQGHLSIKLYFWQ